MTNDERQIAQAIARAFETLSERLSKELEGAFDRTAQLMGRAQKQQYEIMAVLGKQAVSVRGPRCEGAGRRRRAPTNTPPLSSNYCRAR
jgi:hypothetical protein